VPSSGRPRRTGASSSVRSSPSSSTAAAPADVASGGCVALSAVRFVAAAPADRVRLALARPLFARAATFV